MIADFWDQRVFNSPFKDVWRLRLGSSHSGCGKTALALLTGIETASLPYKSAIEDEQMVGFLREKGFTVTPLTLCDLSHDDQAVNWNITKDHVVLISLLTCRNETSWMVLHQDEVWHNFSSKLLEPLEFLNNPIRSAYVVYKKNWA